MYKLYCKSAASTLFSKGKNDNVQKIGYIQPVAFQINNNHSISKSYNWCVCNRALLFSMLEMLHANRNNSKTARSVFHHYYLYSSGLKKKPNKQQT